MANIMTRTVFPFDSMSYNVISILVLVSLLWFVIDLVQTRNMPPSPWFRLPILGHALYFSRRMHEDVANLARRHGPVITLQLGTMRTVFVNGPDVVKEVLVKRSADFSGRPSYSSFLGLGLGGKGVAFSNGDVWKTHRQLMISSLRSKISDQANLENRIMNEVKILLEDLNKSDGKAINPEKMITICVANVICGVGFDKHFDGDEEDFQVFLKSTSRLVKDLTFAGLADFLPVPKVVANYLISSLITNVRKQVSITNKYVTEHEEKFQQKDTPHDLLDGILQAKLMIEDKEKLPAILSHDFVSMTARDIFAAGFETTATALRWAFLYLANHPEYQEAIQTELDKVTGPDQLPSLKKRNEYPLLQAVILETLRLGNIVPMMIPHCSVQDTSIMGYVIPKDTVVFVNMWSVHMDPKCWENPTNFNPYRFIDSDGNLVTNVGNFYPFSAGRRVCPGESLAKVELFLILGSVLHTFKVEHKKEVTFITEEGDVGMAMYPKQYEMVFIKRKP